MDKIPVYSEQLISLLDQLYPAKCPTLEESAKQIYFYAGKRDLIDTLKNLLILQKEEEGLQ